GGKDAFVVGPDIEVEPAAKALAYSALLNAGQVCTSSERVYVAENVAGQFVEALVDEVSRLRLGPGIEPTTDVGPMIGDAYRSKFERHGEDARQKGARILIGGKRPSHLERCYFYEPTVLLDVNHDMLIMSEETYGPAIPLKDYDDFAQAIERV